MNNVPRLKLSAVGKSTFQTPNIPGMRYNGYVKTPRGAGRISVFDTKHGFYTEGSAQTARTARSNAVSASPSWCLQTQCTQPFSNPLFIYCCVLLRFLLCRTPPPPPFFGAINQQKESAMKNSVILANAEASKKALTARRAEPTAGVKPWERDDSEVHVFYAYYQETVPESREETNRSRCFAIKCYSFDQSLQVTEVKRANSGLTQGDFIKRGKVPKTLNTGRNPSQSTTPRFGINTSRVFSSTASNIMGTPRETDYYGVNDFNVGSTVDLYGRQFFINGCDDKTRAYLVAQNNGDASSVPANAPFPQDNFDNMAMGQGVHNWQKNW